MPRRGSASGPSESSASGRGGLDVGGGPGGGGVFENGEGYGGGQGGGGRCHSSGLWIFVGERRLCTSLCRCGSDLCRAAGRGHQGHGIEERLEGGHGGGGRAGRARLSRRRTVGAAPR